jgi:alpha-beta hydrolase superfamily lysophospholipase
MPDVTAHRILSFDQTPIWYDLYPRETSRLALVVPGFWRDRRFPTMRKFAERLTGFGYDAAIMDVRGHGESGGVYGFNRHEHHDVAAVVRDILAKRPALREIVLIGLSTGGAISVTTTARHPDLPIARLLLISSVAKFAMIRPIIHPFSMHRHLAVSQAFRKPRFDWRFFASEKVSALEEVARVHVPITLVHVKNDWLINHRHSVALFERANEPKQLHLLDVGGNFHADRIFANCAESFDPLLGRFMEGESSDEVLSAAK